MMLSVLLALFSAASQVDAQTCQGVSGQRWEYWNNNSANDLKITLVPDAEAAKIASSIQAGHEYTTDTDMLFEMRRDDSSHRSYVKYIRTDTGKQETFVFNGGYADHTRLTLSNDQSIWRQAMNINPSDGQNAGWGSSFWDGTQDVGSRTTAFTKDYKDMSTMTRTGVKYIAIVRHKNGICEGARVWQFRDATKSMAQRFDLSKTQRSVETTSSSINTHISGSSMLSQGVDPFFGADGGLLFNFWYSNNGARIANTEGHAHGSLPSTGTNNDDLHGLGNEFGADTKSGAGSSSWWHDASILQRDCHGTS
jgi:hypothetical protein